MVGMVSIALLISMALGQAGVTSPLLLGKNDESLIAKPEAEADYQNLPEKGLGEGDNNLSQQSRATLADSSPPTTSSGSIFSPTLGAPQATISGLPTASQLPSFVPTISDKPSQGFTDPSEESDDCDADPETCGCQNARFSDYRGSISITKFGDACKRWDETEEYQPGNHPEAGLEENFCRNPEGEYEKDAAWCFTEDPSKGYRDEGWAYCDVQSCGCTTADPEACGCQSIRMTDYRGSISTTESGRTCQRWDSSTPHAHTRTATNYPGTGIEDNNFCRNPDNDLKTWCYTTDPLFRYDYCDVPVCGNTQAPTTASASLSSSSPSLIPSSPPSLLSYSALCVAADKETCGCAVQNQADYRGSISATKGGKECRNWDVILAAHSDDDLYTLEEIEFSGLDGNACRGAASIANFGGAWCYIEEGGPHERGDCDVPFCEPCTCMPPCGSSNRESCGCPSFFQSEECCEDDDAKCKCAYLKNAVRIQMKKQQGDN